MTIADLARPSGVAGRFAPLMNTTLRYGMGAAGPVAVSGAHFLASLIFLHDLPAAAFGLFSFVMVVVAFCMSINVSLISVVITRGLAVGDTSARPTCFQMNWLVCAGFGVLLFAALVIDGAPREEAGVLGLYAFVFTYRWFARCFAYVEGRIGAAIGSDIVYSLLLVGTLAATHWLKLITFASGSQILLLSATVALAPFGFAFFRTQVAALFQNNPKAYWPIFRNLTRWSVTGVILTEITVNAHAYLVTFISGPDSFALLALGLLLMRPASLMQSALPDMERPVIARAIAAGDFGAVKRIQRNFTGALAAAWLGTVLLCAGLLVFYPGIILAKGYVMHDVVLVAVMSAAIMAVRTLRTPLAVFLQAAGEFKALAGIGTRSSIVSVVATLALLLAFGPIFSLLGILLGELVILLRVWQMARDWKRAHA